MWNKYSVCQVKKQCVGVMWNFTYLTCWIHETDFHKTESPLVRISRSPKQSCPPKSWPGWGEKLSKTRLLSRDLAIGQQINKQSSGTALSRSTSNGKHKKKLNDNKSDLVKMLERPIPSPARATGVSPPKPKREAIPSPSFAKLGEFVVMLLLW